MMQTVLTVTAVVLSLAAAGAIVRIARGPSLLDRVLAADVLLAIFGAALCIDMAVNRHLNNLMLLVAHFPHRLRRLGYGGPVRGGTEGEHP